jgi:putative intracellular protease/amidase
MSLKNPNVVNPKSKKRVAIVISNPAISSTTRWPAGFWWSELTHPYYAFNEKGYEVEVFSPSGGKCEPDGMSDPRDPSGYSSSDLVSMGFIHSPKLVALVENTKKVSTIDVRNFDAILVAGGQGPMFTYEKAVDLHKKLVEFYEAGKIACVLCHGVSLLAFAKLSNGNISPKEKPSPASRTSRRSSPTTPYGA